MALRQNLRNRSVETDHDIQRLRKSVAFELFLRRLVKVAPERWVLKGAHALELRYPTTRATKDIDFGRDDDVGSAIEDLSAAQQLDLGDYFSYEVSRSSALDEADFSAVRFHVLSQLAGREFERFTMDIGFGGPFKWTPDRLRISGLLAFAGIEPIELPVIPITQHVAEKLQAYVREYGPDKVRSTRAKDLVDLVLISSSENLASNALRAAFASTFSGREGQELPAALPPPPSDWKALYADLAKQVGVEADLDLAYRRASEFLDPVLAGLTDAVWDAETRMWRG